MRMVICQDLSEVFLPDCDGLVNRINDNVEPITNLLRQLPKEFAHTQDTSNCLGFVLQVILKFDPSFVRENSFLQKFYHTY